MQNVKFDSTNGKMYEELGGSSSSTLPPTTDPAVTATSAALPAVVTTMGGSSAATSSSSVSDYYQTYQSYPYGQQYMTAGFAAGYSGSSYDRNASSMYHHPYNSSGAFGPPQHSASSAINLSVKSSSDSDYHQVFNSRTQAAEILDLTRPLQSSYSPASPAIIEKSSAEKLSSKTAEHQTEPMDFSREQIQSSSFGSSRSSADLARSFRSTAGYSSFGLGASYNSLLSNGYTSTSYSPYGQSSYSCLNYPNSAFSSTGGDPTSFSLSSALSGTGSAG